MRRHLFLAMLLIAAAAPNLRAADAVAPHDLYERIAPSLVVVRFTYDGELGRRELFTSGVVVGADGLVMVSGGFTPGQLPDTQMVDFKIIIPGDEETEIAAEFQGRDERTGMSLVKATESHDWKALKFEDAALQVGDPLYSIGLLPKDAGYKPYLTTASVSSLLRGPVPQVLVTGGGVGVVGSPVLNAQGQAVGIVHAQRDGTPFMSDDPRDSLNPVLDPPLVFVPSRDFLVSISDPPTKENPLKIPHLGVAQLSGLNKDVAEYFGLKKDQPAVQVGDVIPEFPAAKAGLKSGDVIVKVNGETLERGDVPDEAPMIMTRKIMRMKVGDTVTLSVLSGKDQPPHDVKVVLEERPRQANKAKRFYAEDLGFATREIVFEDTYARRLKPDADGVMVALIKPNSSAQTGKLQTGDLITKLNQTEIEGLDQFKSQYELFRKEHPREAVVLEVLRGVNTQVVRIEPPQ
jgi:serine protease Do